MMNGTNRKGQSRPCPGRISRNGSIFVPKKETEGLNPGAALRLTIRSPPESLASIVVRARTVICSRTPVNWRMSQDELACTSNELHDILGRTCKETIYPEDVRGSSHESRCNKVPLGRSGIMTVSCFCRNAKPKRQSRQKSVNCVRTFQSFPSPTLLITGTASDGLIFDDLSESRISP